jgi:hypothetical protein
MVTRHPALYVQKIKKSLNKQMEKQKERCKEKEKGKGKKEFGSWSCVQSSSFACFFPASFGSSLVLLL